MGASRWARIFTRLKLNSVIDIIWTIVVAMKKNKIYFHNQPLQVYIKQCS
jgi:hypothetical protein